MLLLLLSFFSPWFEEWTGCVLRCNTGTLPHIIILPSWLNSSVVPTDSWFCVYVGLWQGMGDYQSWGIWIYQAVHKWQLKDFWTWFLFALSWITQSFSTVIILMRVHTLIPPVDVKICSVKTVSVVALVNKALAWP